jgi:signal transduction histidine kinase
MADLSRAELKYFMERTREEIRALNDVARLLSSTTNPQQIIQLTASYLNRTYPVALCAIYFAPERKLHLIPFAPVAESEIAGAVRKIRETASELLNRTLGEEESVVEETKGAAHLQPAISLRSHTILPITDKGQPVGVLSLFGGQTDAFTKEDQNTLGIIAEQLGAALRIAFLVDELRRADELKNQLLSIVSHELSTPLTAIKEGVSLISDGSLGETTPDQKDFLGTVSDNAERLERLIRKIKTATEIMTGQMRFNFESADVRKLVEHLDRAYGSLARSRNVNVKTLEQTKPVFWPIDAAHASVALAQILENAIQATPADGLVTIKLIQEAAQLEIQITDTGSGIAKDLIPTLFQRFQSIGDINNRKMGGLGLGLFIAKSLMDGHGGTIDVESAPGEGTRMSLKFPKEPQAALAAKTKKKS